MWADHSPRELRDRTLRVEVDGLGHAWLMLGPQRLQLAEVHRPGDVAAMGEYRRLVRSGHPAPLSYDEALPDEFWDPAARLEQLDSFGLAGSVVFPNFGLLWERQLSGDLETLRINMAAWNRWAVTVAQQGQGRLHPVGHLSLRGDDFDWLRDQLAGLAAGGVRLAMVAPALVDGRPLSHPDLDRAWALFVDAGVSPVFHVAAFPTRPFDDAWTDDDPDQVTPVLFASFLWAAPAMAIADMAVHGVFARHPELRLGIMELSAIWLPMFLRHLDGAFAFHNAFDGRPLTELELRPSEYIRRQVRIAAFADEAPADLARAIDADIFMFCSDYPHAEGTDRPLEHYAHAGAQFSGASRDRLYADNVRWLLRVDG
jgi:predicted TIM-barrel fold metal-dependent hydrolase